MKYHDLPSAGPARDITEPEDVPEPPSPESIETPDPDHTFVSDDGTTLAELTTMRVGGKPDELLIAHSSNELVKYASELWDEPWLLLGGGVQHDRLRPGLSRNSCACALPGH